MITLGANSPAGHYPAARSWRDNTHYLYVAVFADRAKVGVSGRLRQRMLQLRRDAGPLQAVHYVEMRQRQARNIENLISRQFGGPTGTAGRASEWFSVEHVDEALLILQDETLREASKTWRQRKLEMARARRSQSSRGQDAAA